MAVWRSGGGLFEVSGSFGGLGWIWRPGGSDLEVWGCGLDVGLKSGCLGMVVCKSSDDVFVEV